MHASRLVLGALTLLVPAILGAQGDARVRSATAEVVRKIVPAVLVSVTNKYTRPVVAIQLSAPPIDAGFRFSDHRSGAAPVPNATILIGETRTLVVRVPAPSSRAVVTAALFEDGHGEGARAVLLQLAQLGPSGSSATLGPAITSDTAVTSIVATSRAGTATDIMVRLNNLRDAPIRAWRIEEYAMRSGAPPTVRAGQSESLCDNGSPGLIHAHEVRDIFWSGTENYATDSLPTLSLGAVLWEDGFAEGSAMARLELQGIRARSHCR
ncbi:MAG TPA: hypothetical protein VJN96_06095 [Vicinamibacterales bacterium]|nr:hypothetical protein [Vicinamibacterales bacterium]